METVKKKEFVEIKYTGFANGEMFDSNIEEDLKKINSEAKVHKIIIAIGEKMVVPGLDDALEGKEVGKEYSINVSAKEGFGERMRELVKTIPLKVFTEKNINPRPGLVLSMDDSFAKIIAVSGARVITDFNNPLAGKDLVYKFVIIRKVIDDKEKISALFEFFFKFIPEFDVQEKITVRGPKVLEVYMKAFSGKFKDLIGKDVVFEEQKLEKQENKETQVKNT